MSETCEAAKESRLEIVNGKLSDLDSRLRDMDNNLSKSLDNLVGIVPEDEARQPEEIKQNNGIIGALETDVANLLKTVNRLQKTIIRVNQSGIA